MYLPPPGGRGLLTFKFAASEPLRREKERQYESRTQPGHTVTVRLGGGGSMAAGPSHGSAGESWHAHRVTVIRVGESAGGPTDMTLFVFVW